jgi:hypothetical protein
MFCREAIGELRRLQAGGADLPRVLFVHQGEPENAAALFEALWPEARAVSDPTLALYRAFGIGRGTPRHLAYPEMWRAALRAYRRGYRQTGIEGDAWLLPGYFLVEEGRILWRHDPAHAGDLPRFAEKPWARR